MRILLVSSRFPLPPWRGNQLRTLQWLEALDDHERLLACPDRGDGPLPSDLGVEHLSLPGGAAGAVRGLASALISGRPAQEGIYDSGAARQRLARVVEERRPDVVVIQMVRCGWAADAIESLSPRAPMIFDAIDCMSLHYRRAAATKVAPLRLLYRAEAARCRRREAGLVRRATVATAVSARDLDALAAGSKGRVVTVAGGVEGDRRRGAAREPVVLLSGNLGYAPTVGAARWFADTVWPDLSAAVPEARWVLAGARPAAAVERLTSRPGVEVYGDVGDLAPFFEQAAVAIAPMSSGSGVPIKILEAMAAGVPVVADPWSAAGLVDASAVAAATEPGEWIDAIRELLLNPGRAERQAEHAEKVWRTAYDPAVVRAQIRDVVEAAADLRAPAP